MTRGWMPETASSSSRPPLGTGGTRPETPLQGCEKPSCSTSPLGAAIGPRSVCSFQRASLLAFMKRPWTCSSLMSANKVPITLGSFATHQGVGMRMDISCEGPPAPLCRAGAPPGRAE
eukprot:CAMPEP_0183411932 /NCGR_PEP_ID=MMETSP0370-20130417/20661_1 /TAXON_ID=268820 /ORGANISM="Peridinium aciculiferum, Strain PAER-2" /LENGTH=117 /DNA_ID=CAMNT_0025594971 /DNA_START=95 /DNA_END=448 /DNA_ORIENTATION=-